MKKEVKYLLEEVNKKLEQKPLFYFSRDVERSLGLENYLNNYFHVCIEDSYIVDQLSSRKSNVLSLNKEGISLVNNSTNELVDNTNVRDWVSNISKSFYAQMFQFNQPAVKSIEDLGGLSINNNSSLNRKFEDKISQFQILSKEEIPMPKTQIVSAEEENLDKFISNLDFKIEENHKYKLVVQLARAHTGSGTFFISNQSEWESFLSKHRGNLVRVSEFIEGDSYTINGCVTKKGVFIAGLQYQITGISELTAGMGSTVGNDFSFANNLDKDVKSQIFNIIKKVGEIMKKSGFRGLFGIDLVVNNKTAYLIEINARQTANIPFQTKLELMQDKLPLALINLAEWLDIEMHFEPSNFIEPLEGSQVFLRSFKDDFEIKNTILSGVYRLQSDYTATLTPKEKVIFLDEDSDKPLIWQEDGYSIDQIEQGGFILHVQKSGQTKNKFDELARMQFNHGIIIRQNNNIILTPWIIEAMREIRGMMI